MNQHTFIIAEAGVNHNGSVDLARQLIDAAASAGADAVKFQTFKTENIVARHAPKAAYQNESTGYGETQYDMLKKLELSPADFKELIRHCRQKNIRFLSTPFDLESIDLLLSLGMELFKIPSGELTNLPYLRKIGGLGKQVILSTGMANIQEIREALQILISSGTPTEKIALLHCNTEYPTPLQDVNLRAMCTLNKIFGNRVGYSDHTDGIEVPIAAVALGAEIIEKHFTLDRDMAGPDHKASLSPDQLTAMVTSIRNIEKALGGDEKKPSPSELPNRDMARKSIVAATAIHAGEVFTEKNITVKRPGTGISPMQWDSVLGKKAPRSFAEDELIEL